MQTGRAIIIAAAIIATTGGAAAYYGPPRYSMTNVGQGLTLRLDRRSGDILGCVRTYCSPAFKDGKSLKNQVDAMADQVAPS